MARRQATIFINGKEVRNNITDITKAKRKLYNELRNLTEGTADYDARAAHLSKELKRLNGILDDKKQKLLGTSKAYDKLSAGASKFIGIAAAGFTIDAVIDYGKQLFNLGAQMEVLQKKAQTVFGSTLPQVTMAAEENAAAMGLTTQQYINAAAGIQDLLIPMKFQREEATGISLALTDLSGALSEWTGGQIKSADVSQILSKALLGEREELKQLGISIMETDVTARLAEKGLDKLTGTLLQQAKATATLELITEKSLDAQTAYAENADTLVRRQAEVSAKFSEVSEKMATALIPVFERLIDVADGVADVINVVTDTVVNLSDPIKNATSAFDEQAKRVNDLKMELNPLLDRYEDLTNKSDKTKEEQDELAKVIERIGILTPTAVTEIDQYGRALSINADASRDFLEAEKARLQFINQEAIVALEDQIGLLEDRQKILNETAKTGRGGILNIEYDPQTLQAFRDDLRDVTKDLEGARAQLARLTGGDLPDAGTTGGTAPPVDLEAAAAQEEARKKAEDDRKKAADKRAKELEKNLQRLNDITAQFREDARLAELDEDEQALERLRQRYQKEIDLAIELEDKGVQQATAQRLELERLRDQAVSELLAEQLETRINSQLEKELELEAAADEVRIQAEEERRIEEQTRKLELEQQLKEEADAVLLSSRELALQELDAHYQDLIRLAEQYGLDTNDITEAYRVKRLKTEQEFNKKEQQEIFQQQQARLAVLQETFTAFGNLASSAFDLLISKEGEHVAAQKIATLAQIALDTASAISSLTANSEANPTNAVTFGAAGIAQFIAGIARITTNIAKAKSVLSEVPQRKDGGYMDVIGQDDGRQYHARYIGSPQSGMLPSHPVVLASEAGPEYFVSNKDLRNPQVLDYVRAIENIRLNRIGQFQDGGFTTPVAAPTAPAGPDPTQQAVLQAITQLNAILSNGVMAIIEDQVILEMERRKQKMRQAAGGPL
ncbi:coiled-coil domain-containing protein [Flavilitoribacter nigricans]|uniref:Uncharacterized protein n=1 Tax=Flavilitoribacter nigricans (strain ATCC 23147 / DSM 23189 / NBRC 102662 / NCIMB 1420 / SS-2) TaxID=1122177 RepID=A0A2D0NEN5_FLAN2|nr:hypothetical protein [Flavilitoribacter nigricans]PHN06937.1 hypothetical protein CRP01_08975 [Flavilitoribacter nigricans DSM 23189 = NBRC 102662]